MVYIFENPDTGEFVEVFQAANDSHTYEKDGSRIIKAESTVDTSKNKVIFKFYIENQNN
jgi:hypothetical protein